MDVTSACVRNDVRTARCRTLREGSACDVRFMADLTVSTPSDIKICKVKSRLSHLMPCTHAATTDRGRAPSSRRSLNSLYSSLS